MHCWHSRHILHWPWREICGAVRTECPAQFQEPFALGAWPLELLTAGGADLEIRFDTSMAIVTGLALGHLSQQGFFLQLPLVDLCQCLAGTQDHIDEEPTNKEDRNQ